MNHDGANATGPLGDVGEHRVRLTEREAQDNLRAMLQLCAAGQLRCSEKTKRPSAATMDTVADHLAGGDFYLDDDIAAFAWPLVLQAGGLAKVESGRLRLTAKGRAAQRKPPAEVIRGLWQRWIGHAVIDEFSRIEQIKGQRAGNVLSAATTRRQVVATALAGCPSEDWIGVDALFATMRRNRLNPTIARNEMARWKLYLVDPQYGSLGYAGYGDWEILEGRYTLAVLFEYAGTLGLFDLEYVHPHGERDDFRDNWGAEDLDALSRYDGLQAVRLTALGRYAFGLTGSYLATVARDDTPRLKVLPDLTMVATGSLDPADELLLSGYAERTADQVWALSEQSLLSALDTGRDLDELTTFLTQRSHGELPETLANLLDDVTDLASQLTDLGHVRLIECTEPELAQLIARDRQLRTLCRMIGDRHLAVPIDAESRFRAALPRLGYVLPSSSGL